jgi:hypothetical protein
VPDPKKARKILSYTYGAAVVGQAVTIVNALEVTVVVETMTAVTVGVLVTVVVVVPDLGGVMVLNDNQHGFIWP